MEPRRPPVAIGEVPWSAAEADRAPFNSAFWRGIGSPAGALLTTAAGALALVRAFRGIPSGFLSPEMRAEATRNQTDDRAGGFEGFREWSPCPWGLGPEERGTKEPHAVPARAGADSSATRGSPAASPGPRRRRMLPGRSWARALPATAGI